MNQTTQANASKLPSLTANLLLCLGLLCGLLAIAGPLGVWLQLWNFRTGFLLLGAANKAGSWLSLVMLVIILVVFLPKLGTSKTFRNGLQKSVIGLIGALLAWQIPESYRPGEEVIIPPIHDISSDTTNPPEFEAVLPLRGADSNTTVYGGSPDMTPEKLAALQTEAYPEIVPQYYDQASTEVFDAALQAAESMGWEIAAADKERLRIEATDTTFWFRFKDDVVVRINTDNGQTRLDARSVSRVGVSDVGKNADRLNQYFKQVRIELGLSG